MIHKIQKHKLGIAISSSGWAILILYLIYEYTEYRSISGLLADFSNTNPPIMLFHIMILLAPIISMLFGYFTEKRVELQQELKKTNEQLQQDITWRKRAEETIKRRLEFEKTISAISSRFVGVTDIDDAINASLGDIGRLSVRHHPDDEHQRQINASLGDISRLSGASRAYLFLLRGDKNTMDNTHEWCTKGVSPQIDNLQNLSTVMFPRLMAKLWRGEVIHIRDVSKMPSEEKAEMEKLGSHVIKSLLVLPLRVGGVLAGFIGFDNVRKTGRWRFDELTLLRISSEIIGSALERKCVEEALKEYSEKLEYKITELEDANRKINRLTKVQSRFIGQVSHDLRTPLTPIMTLLPIVERHAEDPKMKRHLKIMHENAKYLNRLVVETLTLSRLDSGNVEYNFTPVDIKSLIEETIMENEPVFKENDIVVKSSIPDNLPKVYINELSVKEVLQNLVSNALKFMQNGRSKLTFGVKELPDYLQIKVKDTGIGMEKEIQKKVFDEFFKADESRHEKSAGLGLAICKRMIDKHGGSIWAESTPRKGSSFYFTLPIYRPGIETPSTS